VHISELGWSVGNGVFGSGVIGTGLCAYVMELYVMGQFKQGIFSLFFNNHGMLVKEYKIL
jgi:hypothetical protein